MGIILWIIFGGIAGWLASLVMSTSRSQGIFTNIIVGVVGALIGGALFSFLGGTGVTGFNIYSLLIAVLGAIVLLWFIKLIR
jgi:uncharacterized membrane protein YeaQ/YmgE (transglycosylase-associated protein family)